MGELVGVDLEPMARTAAERDRPGVYDDYLVGDLGAWSEAELDRLRAYRPTALVALSAVGVGHVPGPTLARALGLLGPGGIYAFAVAPAAAAREHGPRRPWPPDTPSSALRCRTTPSSCAASEYVHRYRADGSEDLGIAFVGRMP